MMRGPGAAVLLERALTASAARAGARVDLAGSAAVAWHSATFDGARHAFDLEAPVDGGVVDWLAALGETDLPLSGHLVADLSVTHRSERGGMLHVRIEALTVVAAA